MRLFSKTELVNLPIEPMTVIPKSDKTSEVTRLYTIRNSAVTVINGEVFYEKRELRRIQPNAAHDSLGLEWFEIEEMTNGKKTIFTCNQIPILEFEGNTPTFHPEYFRLLAKENRQLLRIQAPVKWHQTMNRLIDPEITCIWKPHYS